MILRCTLDGLLLPAEMDLITSSIRAYDGEEGFVLEAVEALHYEVVTASKEEIIRLQQGGYRLLRLAEDFFLDDRTENIGERGT